MSLTHEYGEPVETAPGLTLAVSVVIFSSAVICCNPIPSRER